MQTIKSNNRTGLAAICVLSGIALWGCQTQQGAAPDKVTITPLKMAKLTITASGHEESQWGKFVPANTVDGDPAAKSSWRADGDGQWIAYDLGGWQALAGVEIAFVQGDQRTYSFTVQASDDGETWTDLLSASSSGKTADPEMFPLPPVATKHLRIVGHGNSKKGFEKWINLTEVRILVVR